MRKLCAAALPFCGAVWLAVTVLPSGWLIPLGIGCLALALLSGFLRFQIAFLLSEAQPTLSGRL